MNIETKTIRYGVDEYLKFGWSHTEEVRRLSGRSYYSEYILARDKDMQNYKLVKALESKYFDLKNQKKDYTPIDGLWCFIAFACLIFPGIVYVAFKLNQKTRIEAFNADVQSKMDAVVKEVTPLI